MWKRVFFSLLLISLAHGAEIIKFATVAPRNSGWMREMLHLDSLVRVETGGAVGFRFYAGGVQGDERDVLRKIRIGQLHAGGFTGVGLGTVLPAARILDLPFLFHSSAEVDFILERFTPEFEKRFQEAGFVLLGWTEVGLVHFFSRRPLRTLEEVQACKLWVWEDDPLARKFFREMGVSPYPLSLPQVLTAFQTGMIDAAYASPYGAAVLQWPEQVRYVSPLPISDAAGALLLARDKYARLTPRQQEILLRLSREQARRITREARENNRATLAAFPRRGITVGPEPDSLSWGKMQHLAAQVRAELAGELYGEDLYRAVADSLEAFRRRRP
jgi:TRAP-type C4-dicarboxylate transport system substrate-binding protein